MQAAIAALHAQAERPDDTDWPQIAALYDQRLRIAPTPIAALNRAIAVATTRGPEHGLELIDQIRGLDRYHLLHAARADMMRRANRPQEASRAYRIAIDLTRDERERVFLRRRLAEVRQLAGSTDRGAQPGRTSSIGTSS